MKLNFGVFLRPFGFPFLVLFLIIALQLPQPPLAWGEGKAIGHVLSSRDDSLPPRVYLPIASGAESSGPMVEVRALWVTRWDYSSPADLRTIVRKAADAHFNVIWLQVRGQADAYYRSSLEPWAARLSGTLGHDPGWDPLGLAIAEAHAAGLQLHAYVNVYPAWLGTTPPAHAIPEPMYHAFNALYGNLWVMWNDQGQPMTLRSDDYLYASPAYPPVADHIANVVQDLVSRYEVDGVHLDLVRYAGPRYSYDPKSNAAYADARAKEPGLSRAEWQRRQITRLVGRLREELRAARPRAWLSAAVWPAYRDHWDWWTGPDGYDGYYQDSVGWLLGGQADAIAPMLYTANILGDNFGFQAIDPFTLRRQESLMADVLNNPTRYQILVDDFMALAQGRLVLPGIYGDYPEFYYIAERIRWAREAGARGQAIFSYRLLNQRDYWDELVTGPYARPAILPTFLTSP